MLFGLVFLVIGGGFLLLGVLPNLWDAWRMQDWVQVPAAVEALDLQTSDSDDSTTYRVAARFRYDYQGQRYTGERVGIADGGSDNVGEWQRDTWRRLRNQDQVRLWVNPAEPSESVFDRELRWGLLGFKLIFVIVFGGLGAVALWYLNRTPEPVPPGLSAWQARAVWHDNRILSNARSAVWFAWGFAVFWNAISAPIPFILPGELAKGNQLAWIALVFPVVGFGLLVRAIRQTLNWRRFGTTRLQLDPFPGAIGGDVGGVLELRLAYHPEYRFRVTLTCQHVYTRRTNNGNRTVRDAQWQDEQLAEVQPGMHGTRLRFLFRPPDNLPGSSAADTSRHEWTVQIAASLPGMDFDRSWEIPVFRDAGPQTASDPVRHRSTGVDSLDLPDRVVRFRETGDGIEFYYPYVRQTGLAFGTLVTGGGFAGFAWLFQAAKGKDIVSSVFPGLFAAVGVLILVGGIYLLGNSLRVTVGRQELRVVRGILGLQFARRVSADGITGIEKSIAMQYRQGNRTHAYYRIQVHTCDGRSITAGSGIPGASRVEFIIRRMRAALGLSNPESASDNTAPCLADLPAALSAGDASAGLHHTKRISRLMRSGAGLLLLALVLWSFRGVIFRLLSYTAL
jgi:hypothetical protein